MNSLQDIDKVEEKFLKIQEELTSPLPKGTVQLRTDKKGHMIPVQVYINRLEKAATGFWSWHTIGEPVIYEKENQMMVKGVLKILHAEREGIGFSHLQRDENKRIKSLKSAVLSASSDALRNACDKYRMGWVDLAPYRDWSSNPGVELSHQSSNEIGESEFLTESLCSKCQKRLTTEEVRLLDENNIRLKYCKEHIPNHFMKGKGNQ